MSNIIDVHGQRFYRQEGETDEQLERRIRTHFETQKAAPSPSPAAAASGGGSLLDHFLGGGDLMDAFGDTGASEAALSGITDTVASNYQDETLGALFAGLSGEPTGLGKHLLPDEIRPTDDYSDMRDQMRALLAAQQEEYPEAYDAGTLAGMAVPGTAASKWLGGMSLSKAAPRLALAGGASGAAAGYGYSEDPELAPLQTGIQAATGAASAFAGPLAGAGVRAATRLARSPFQSTARPWARRRLKKDIKQAGLKPDEIEQGIAHNPNMVMADAHPMFQSRLREAGNYSPDFARRAGPHLDQRQAGTRDRIADSLADALGDTPTWKAAEIIRKAMRDSSKPRYDAAFSMGVTPTPRMEAALTTPSGQKAIREARKLVADADVGDPPPVDQIPPFNPDGSPNLRSLRFWDEFHQAIESGAAKAKRKKRGPTDKRGRVRDNLKDSIIEDLEEQSPIYQDARRDWARGSSAQEALKDGRKAFKEFTPDLRNKFKKMSRGDKAMFRLGAFEAIDDVISKKGAADRMGAFFKDRKKRDILEIVIDDDEMFKRFMRSLDDEIQMENTWSAARNLPLLDSKREASTMPAITPEIWAWQKARSEGAKGILFPWQRAQRTQMGEALMSRNPRALDNPMFDKNLGALAGLGMSGALIPSANPWLPR